jgi:O-antigen/teichoic acid export membrane protein
LLSFIINLILLLPFYTRALSPSEYGILDTLVTFAFFTSVILSLGLAGATSRYYFVADTEKEKGQVLYTSLVIRIFSYLIPLFFLIYFSNNISELLFKTDEYKYVVAISLATIFITAMFEIQSQIFRFNREPWKFTLVNIVRAIITPIAGILLVVILKLGVFGATLSSFITSTIILVFAFFYYTRKKYTRDFSKYWAKKMLKFGFPLIFTGILVWVNSVSDRFFLLHYSTLEQIGLYSIGNTFSQPITLINMALTMSATVLVFSLYNDEQDENKPKKKDHKK